MNLIPKNHKHLIVLGVVVFLCFLGMALFMNNKLKARTELLSNNKVLDIYYQHKASNVNHEFSKLISGLSAAERMMMGIQDQGQFIRRAAGLKNVLQNDPQVSQGWYAYFNPKDTLFNVPEIGAAKIKSWLRKEFTKKNDPQGSKGALITQADSLYWLQASRFWLADSTMVLIGLEVNLQKFQKYLWNVQDKSIAYAIIVDGRGYCISHPDINFIGKRLPGLKQDYLDLLVKNNAVIKETVFSSYLGLPVLRTASVFHIGAMDWVMLVDTPAFVVDEEINGLRKNFIVIGLFSILIIVGVMAYLQHRWQKELMLRLELDANRKLLLLERKQLQVRTEKQEKENALLQLKVLKDKVNPHFLFNSMGSLNALIDRDTKLAREFVIKLSRVYRYLLDSYPNGLAGVAEELDFAAQYWFLLHIRFGEAMLPMSVEVKEEHLDRKLPFLSIQIAIENAVKHNMLSKEKPLKISIRSQGDKIVVVNNLQLRAFTEDSGKQGLSYIAGVYHYLEVTGLEHGQQQGEYRCAFPLL